MPHQGELLQEAIKLSGIPISKLVQDLGITRPTIYRKFREATLDVSFVTRVQEILGRSITPDTPTSVTHSVPSTTSTVTPPFTNSPNTIEEYANALIILQQKHIKLLEDYQALLTKLYTGR
jgi:predicted transcriptional regulator